MGFSSGNDVESEQRDNIEDQETSQDKENITLSLLSQYPMKEKAEEEYIDTEEVITMDGTLDVEILGLIGLAKISDGDVFEVYLKHGPQKFVTGFMVKDGTQIWRDKEFTFEISLAVDLLLKVLELKGSTEVQIGCISCPTADFVSENAQICIIPINKLGTMKLRLRILWKPKKVVEENGLEIVSKEPSKVEVSPLSPLMDKVHITVEASLSEDDERAKTTEVIANQDVVVAATSEYDTPETTTPVTEETPGDAPDALPDVVELVIPPPPASPPPPVPAVEEEPEPPSIEVSEPITVYKKIVAQVTLRHAGTQTIRERKDSHTNLSEVVDTILQAPPVEPVAVVSEPPAPQEERRRTTSQTSQPPVAISVNIGAPKGFVDVAPDYDMPPPQKKRPEELKVRSTSTTTRQVDQNGYIRMEQKLPSPDTPSGDAPPPAVRRKGNGSSSIPPSPVDDTDANMLPRRLDSEENEVIAPLNIKKIKPHNDTDIIEVLTELSDAIFDVMEKGSYNVLMTLKENVDKMKLLLQQGNTRDQYRSVTPSIISALDGFNFLETLSVKTGTLPPDFSTKDRRNTAPMELNTFSSAPRDALRLGSWMVVRPVILHHLRICLDLLSFIGISAGPLHYREFKAVSCLERQNMILGLLVRLWLSSDTVTVFKACPSISTAETLYKIWNICVTENCLLCETDMLKRALTAFYNLTEKVEEDDELCQQVCTKAIERIGSQGRLTTESGQISVYQFFDFFKEEAKTTSVVTALRAIKHEVTTLESLRSTDDLVVASVLREYMDIPVAKSCLRMIAVVFVTGDKTVKDLTEIFLSKIPPEFRPEACNMYTELLEDKHELVRGGSCLCLAKLEYFQALPHIAYLAKVGGKSEQMYARVALAVLGKASQSSGFPMMI